ncbi:hypothetical protein [Methanobrevibacter smithii]|uniref:hypothetical protein n=1 Tax=Methanobrevibacter smithii TaxID=2173 RepID=UPI00037BF187|nr:hypothetical protein [Methanobrevibacter smithii]
MNFLINYTYGDALEVSLFLLKQEGLKDSTRKCRLQTFKKNLEEMGDEYDFKTCL